MLTAKFSLAVKLRGDGRSLSKYKPPPIIKMIKVTSTNRAMGLVIGNRMTFKLPISILKGSGFFSSSAEDFVSESLEGCFSFEDEKDGTEIELSACLIESIAPLKNETCSDDAFLLDFLAECLLSFFFAEPVNA